MEGTYVTLTYVSFRNFLSKTGKTDLTGVMGERLPNNRIHYKAVFFGVKHLCHH